MSETLTQQEYSERMDAIHALVANIAHGSDGLRHPARERVDYYRAHFPDEFPPWLEGTWYELLISEVECLEADKLAEPDESEWDGSDWRTRWDGYPRHEHPSHDPPAYASGGW